MTVRFPAPPASSIKRDLRHADFEHNHEETVWFQPLRTNTVLLAIRAVSAFNQF